MLPDFDIIWRYKNVGATGWRKKKMIISTDAKKPFDKTQHLLWQKILKTRNKGKLPWCNKAIYEKAIANIILISEKLKALPLRSGIRQGCLFSSFLLNIVLEVLAIAIREEKEIKWIQIRIKVKVSLFADDMILHI